MGRNSGIGKSRIISAIEYFEYQRYFYFTVFKYVRMVGTIFCTVLWFAVLDDLEYFTVYYIWPIDAMFSIAILVLRIIQHGYRIQKRMTFESIDIGLDLAGFIGSVIAAIFAYREFHSKRVSAALWKFSILTATVHLLDFWLLVDYSEEKRVCCAG